MVISLMITYVLVFVVNVQRFDRAHDCEWSCICELMDVFSGGG
jgi:hypothetical protein